MTQSSTPLLHEVVDERPRDDELVARPPRRVPAGGPRAQEVDDDLLVLDIEEDRLVDAGADHVGLLEEGPHHAWRAGSRSTRGRRQRARSASMTGRLRAWYASR